MVPEDEKERNEVYYSVLRRTGPIAPIISVGLVIMAYMFGVDDWHLG